MIKVNKLIPEGAKGKFGIMKFDISFDSASHLPVDTYTLNMTTFIIANGSIAKNIQTGIYYEYNNGKWNKTTNIPSDTDNNTITTSGIHTIANNDIGVSRINVDIPSAPEPTLIDKTITANGEYNASDDSADGYSEVTVDVTSIGMPKLATPVAAANMFKNYDYINIDTKLSYINGDAGIYEQGVPDAYKKYCVYTQPVSTIVFSWYPITDHGFYEVVFVAGNNFSIKYYEFNDSTTTTTVSLGTTLTSGKVYRIKLHMNAIQGRKFVYKDSIEEYNEPIKFTVT